MQCGWGEPEVHNDLQVIGQLGQQGSILESLVSGLAGEGQEVVDHGQVEWFAQGRSPALLRAHACPTVCSTLAMWPCHASCPFACSWSFSTFDPWSNPRP